MGGGTVPTRGPSRTRVATAVGALADAALLAVLPAASGANRQGILTVLGAVGIVATVTALAGRVAALWWAIVALGAGYALSLVGRDTMDVRAPVTGAALLVLAELVQGSLRASSPAQETAPKRGRLVELGVLGLSSVVLGSLVLAAGAVAVRRGPGLTIVGAAGSVAVLGLVCVLAGRSRRAPAEDGEGTQPGPSDGTATTSPLPTL